MSVTRHTPSHFERVTKVLRGVHARRGNGEMLQVGDGRSLDGEAVDWKNPLTELMEKEDRERADLAEETSRMVTRINDGLESRLPGGALRDGLMKLVGEQGEKIARDCFDALHAEFLEWLFHSGPNPLEVVKRLFAYVKMKRPDLLWNMSFRELGELLNETHATMHARCERLFEGERAGWKKTASARANMSRAQIGNTNRAGSRAKAESKQRRKGARRRKKILPD